MRKHFTKYPSSPKSDRRGSVLVAVLAIILLLTFLITRFMNEAVEDLEYRALFNEPVDVRSAAFSVLEMSLAVIQEVALIDEGKLYAPEQGWSDPISYAQLSIPGGWDATVTIQDEGGLLPLNKMPEAELNKLFEETLDFDFGTSRELSSTLLDWIDSDDDQRLNGAESEIYLARNPPYRAANGPLQSLEELRLLEVWEEEFFDEKRRPNERFQRLKGLVSLHTAGPINLNAAPQLVMDMLSENQGWDSDYIFDGLDTPYLKERPGSVESELAGVEIGLLRVTVTIQRGNAPYVISALVEPNFNEGNASSAKTPGRSSQNDNLKTGTEEEQAAIHYPFLIVQLNEYGTGGLNPAPARYSAVDIPDENGSF